jgi:hypothetical protein
MTHKKWERPLSCTRRRKTVFFFLFLERPIFYPQEHAKHRGYTSCFVVVVVVVACLLVLYSMKQFKSLTLQQGSHACMHFGILPLQMTAERLYAV